MSNDDAKAREINLVCMSGQGSVQTVQLLARAFFEQHGMRVRTQVAPGGRPKSSPVVSYLKASAGPIAGGPNFHPDDVLLFWSGLLRVAANRAHPTVTDAIARQRSGNLIINSRLAPGEIELPYKFSGAVATVDADSITNEILRRDPPPVGVTMAGAYIAVTEVVELDRFLALVKERFPGRLGEQNVEAARRAYEEVRIEREVVGASQEVPQPRGPEDRVDPLSRPPLPVLISEDKGRPRGYRGGAANIWRTKIPVSDDQLCGCDNMCISEVMCPDNTGFIVRKGLPHQGYRVDVDLCRGCGICAEVCVYSALSMANEEELMRTNPTYEGITVEPFINYSGEGGRS
jgi:pyruvate ferredoxin oxidoreductase gamma subunit